MDSTDQTRECPFCKELVKADAIKCKHCGSALAPERASHGGICPYCKEQIHPDAIKCKHCKSLLLSNPQRGCDCEHSERGSLPEDLLSAAVAGKAAGGSPVSLRAQRIGNHIILGGPLDPGDPLPCEGHYECFTLCLPRLGCHTACIWVCEIF